MPGLLNYQLRTAPAVDDEREPPQTAVADTSPVQPEPASETSPEPAPGPLVPLEGGRMTQRGQTLAALSHALRVARRNYLKLAERDGGMVHGLTRGQPPSVHDQHQYAKDRHWVPPGHDGGTLEGMGDIYHWLIGRPWVAFGNAVSAIAHHPFRWCGTAAISLILANTGLLVTGHHFAATVTDAGAGLLLTLWAGAGYLLSCIKRALSTTTTTIITGEDEPPAYNEEDAE